MVEEKAPGDAVGLRDAKVATGMTEENEAVRYQRGVGCGGPSGSKGIELNGQDVMAGKR